MRTYNQETTNTRKTKKSLQVDLGCRLNRGGLLDFLYQNRIKQQVTLLYLNTSHHPEGAAKSSSKPGFDPTEL